ncbi:MAG TPA: diguanylate cyclase domain-containing protein [Xenococcaceae cyanobacterium]
MTEPKGRILLVDDNQDILELLDLLLSEKGYATEIAQEGTRAISLAQQNSPDLILLDLMMPKLNGYQVCSTLKNNHTTQEIPIIVISALEQVDDKVQALKMGAVDYITKPFCLEEVVARVERQMAIRQLQKKVKKQNELLLKEIERRQQVEAKLRETNLKLNKLATSDGLTGIANRRYFEQYLQQEWQRLTREQAPLSLIILDIDYFKQYNDTYGHQAGDNCLQQVAQAICSAAKRPADLVARYGGEEFAVILPRTDLEGATYIARKIQTAIRYLQIKHENSTVNNYVTVSQGVTTTVPTLDNIYQSLICVADIALYDAKKKGRNCIESCYL